MFYFMFCSNLILPNSHKENHFPSGIALVNGNLKVNRGDYLMEQVVIIPLHTNEFTYSAKWWPHVL